MHVNILNDSHKVRSPLQPEKTQWVAKCWSETNLLKQRVKLYITHKTKARPIKDTQTKKNLIKQ